MEFIYSKGDHNKMPAGPDGYVFNPNDHNLQSACHREPGKMEFSLS